MLGAHVVRVDKTFYTVSLFLYPLIYIFILIFNISAPFSKCSFFRYIRNHEQEVQATFLEFAIMGNMQLSHLFGN